MATLEQPTAIDMQKLEQFVFSAVDEVGATLNTALVVMGDKLGLYRALAGAGGLTPVELAARTGVSERYVREWLNAQAAGGYVEYDPAAGTLHAAAGAGDGSDRRDEPGLPARLLPDRARLRARLAAHHRGRPHRRRDRLARARSRRLRRLRALLPARLQRQPHRRLAARARRRRREARARRAGRRRRLRARLVDDPDGAGVPELDVRRAPTTTTGSIETARKRAAEAGVGDRIRFEHVPAATYPGTGYDLVTMFDCLHDMGDPVGAARHVRETLADGRHVDDRRADGRRPRRGQPQPGRARVLRLLHAALHAGVAVAGGRARARRAGRRGADPRRRGGGRASPASGARPRLRSTSCSKRGRDV